MEKIREEFPYRIDGDVVIIKLKSGYEISFEPVDRKQLVGGYRLDGDYYDAYHPPRNFPLTIYPSQRLVKKTVVDSDSNSEGVFLGQDEVDQFHKLHNTNAQEISRAYNFARKIYSDLKLRNMAKARDIDADDNKRERVPMPSNKKDKLRSRLYARLKLSKSEILRRKKLHLRLIRKKSQKNMKKSTIDI